MTTSEECVVLVTGGSGFLGQHLIGLLQTRAPHVTEIRVVDLPSNPYINKLDYEASKPVIQFLGSINDPELLQKACKGVHCVMHIAGYIDVSMFPDTRKLELVNFEGTAMLVDICKQVGVRRFLYCSTMDVVTGYDDIINGTEHTTSVPEVFFFNGYASTKQRAEKLVLAADCERFRTLAIRPTTMYGEEDTLTVSEPIRNAGKYGRWIRFDCKNALHQMTYSGNVAWAFICAERALAKTNNTVVSGKAYFITDSTPVTDIFDFLAPFARACGFSTDTFKIPAWIVLYFMYLLYVLMWLMSLIIKVNLRVGLCSFKFMTKTFTFKSETATRMLNYKPLYSYDESLKRSLQFYVKQYRR